MSVKKMSHIVFTSKKPINVNTNKNKNTLEISIWLNICTVLHIHYIFTRGGPLSALTCCVNVRHLSGDKKNIAVNLFSKLGWELGLYYASYDDFHPDILARMYT